MEDVLKEMERVHDKLAEVNEALKEVIKSVDKIAEKLSKGSARGRLFMLMTQLSTVRSYVEGGIKALKNIMKEYEVRG